eukprot:scaffold154715_cov36-Prasinocladus_malaysianus.AAC.1
MSHSQIKKAIGVLNRLDMSTNALQLMACLSTSKDNTTSEKTSIPYTTRTASPPVKFQVPTTLEAQLAMGVPAYRAIGSRTIVVRIEPA